ncbi:MAG: type VI secretion system baseplate subunit TssG [Planctomycetota bacterium]
MAPIPKDELERRREEVTADRLEQIRAVEEVPWRYRFYQLLRLTETIWPDQPRLGESVRATRESVRIGQEPMVVFAPSTVASVTWTTEAQARALKEGESDELVDGAAPRDLPDIPEDDPRRIPGPPGMLSITNYAFGLLGPNGPMPLHFTEYVRDREMNHRDTTMRAFVDVFHHRMSCLLYRAWASSRAEVSRDRAWDDPFTRYLGSLAGIGTPSLRERDSTLDDAKRFHVGVLCKAARGPVGLSSLLSDEFEAPVRVQEFVGRWVKAPPESTTRLGMDPASGILGQTAFVGERFWDCQQTFRVVLGPMDIKTFVSMLPGTLGMRRLRDWVRLYNGRLLRCEAQLVLKKEDVPPLRLGSGPGVGARLGWTTWLRSKEPEHDADEAIFVVEA